MIKKKAVGKPSHGPLPADVEGFDSLAELALDLRSSWNHSTDEVWRKLDPVQWELTHNPWGLLKTISQDHLARALAIPAFDVRWMHSLNPVNMPQQSPAGFSTSIQRLP